jgi:hypothetical protein
MSRTIKNEKLVEIIFKPDPTTGISNWKTRDEIDKTELKLGNNGNIREQTPWTDKYKWEIKRLNNKDLGKPIAFRTIGFSGTDIKDRKINNIIREKLLNKYNNCAHCGNHKNLVIDHKNDMYNDDDALNIDTQTEEHFQVLCNKCNKDLKHQTNVKEKKTGELHSVKKLNYLPFKYDNCNYPWEIALKKYDKNDKNCKNYTYWYDIEEFHRKRHIFITITKPINYMIKKTVKLIN